MTELLSYLNCAIRVVGGRPWDSRWSFTLSVKESAEVLPGCGWRVGWQRRPFRPIGAAPERGAQACGRSHWLGNKLACAESLWEPGK